MTRLLLSVAAATLVALFAATSGSSEASGAAKPTQWPSGVSSQKGPGEPNHRVNKRRDIEAQYCLTPQSASAAKRALVQKQTRRLANIRIASAAPGSTAER